MHFFEVCVNLKTDVHGVQWLISMIFDVCGEFYANLKKNSTEYLQWSSFNPNDRPKMMKYVCFRSVFVFHFTYILANNLTYKTY